MPTFQSLSFPTIIDTSTYSLTNDFFAPLLSHAQQYDRGVAYFGSGWLRLNGRSLVALVENGGRARWIISPILDKGDWLAMLAGEAARHDSQLRAAMGKVGEQLRQSLEEDTLAALAWLVAHELVSFRITVPCERLEGGDFHDKFGVFRDGEGNQVSFNGSVNDSIQGGRNYESLKVFVSWEPAFAPLVEADAERFERLWHNADPNVQTYDLSEADLLGIVEMRAEKEQEERQKAAKAPPVKEPFFDKLPTQPMLPAHITLRDYQEEAIAAWFAHDCQGLLEMATGTGKTITALVAALRLYKREKRLIIVVACPFIHLVSQWAGVVEQFGFKYVMTVESKSWRDEVTNQILDVAAGYIDNLVILTTHYTFCSPPKEACRSPRFADIMQEKSLPLLLIVDEAHDVGAPKRRQGLLDCYRYRLGLSATPQRWFDEQGTNMLLDYFGDVVFTFPLAKAIPDFLTPYEYFPHFVELTDEELDNYRALTRKIVRRAYATEDDVSDEQLALYMILRQRIITNAAQKYHAFEQLLDSLSELGHTLVYCSPAQIEHVQRLLNARGIIQSRFTGEESLQERSRLLTSFAEGKHQVLVAMKCLDQGVDVPSTRTAILLASSGNPKEFIQRRGRVLRKFPGKKKATLYDIIVVPTLKGKLDELTLELERKILANEMRRYDEFATLSLNRITALNKIGPIKRKYLIR